VVIDVQASGAGLLVLLDAPLPGWKARVDGRETPVYPANVLGRAIALPPGARQVEFRYAPPFWGLGIAASLLSLVLLVPFGWWTRRQSGAGPRPRAAPEGPLPDHAARPADRRS
jgi:uncharacterized membrane protein YfhO